MENAFHKLDHLAKNQAIHWDWIKYLEAERKILMATVEDLQAKLPALDEAVRQVGDYVSTLSRKVDEATAEHPAVQEMIGHVTGLTEALARMVPQEVKEAFPVAAPDAPQGQQAAPDMGVTADARPE